jgi:hypothetical protein
MDVERLRQLRRAVPWKPYVLIMVDGRRFIIDQPPYMGVSPDGRLVLVSTEGNKVEWFGPDRIRDAILIDSISPSPSQTSSKEAAS